MYCNEIQAYNQLSETGEPAAIVQFSWIPQSILHSIEQSTETRFVHQFITSIRV